MAKIDRAKFVAEMDRRFGPTWRDAEQNVLDVMDEVEEQARDPGGEADPGEGQQDIIRPEDDPRRKDRPSGAREKAVKDHRELAATAQVPPGDTLPPLAWVLRGIVGGTNLLKGMVSQGTDIPEYWAHYMDEAATRLKDTAKTALEKHK